MKLWRAAALFVGLAAGQESHENTGEFEYVVVGSGPGGGTLATNGTHELQRKSCPGGHSVFLIEAGYDTGDELIEQVPAWSGFAVASPNITWNFFVNHYQNFSQATRDSSFAYRLNNGSYYVGIDPPADAKPLGIYYPRGATLGGSSQINAMYFIAPPDNNWRHIAELTKDDSWMPENMREYFIELERNGYLRGEHQPGHGYNGFISTAQSNNITSRPGIVRVVSESIREFEGVQVENERQTLELLKRDINRIDANRYEKPEVFTPISHIDARGRRSGARNYIIDTFNARRGDGSQKYPLTISTRSLATRVLFRDGHSSHTKPRAYGVEYLLGDALYSADDRYDARQSGQLKRVHASREVIVAEGTFNSPQILKLSGIGPRAELEKLKIPVVKDLHAGNYLQDNYEGIVRARAGVAFENNPSADCKMNPSLPPSEDPCPERWETQGSGPYADGLSRISILFRSSDSQDEDCDVCVFGGPGDFHGFFPGYTRQPSSNNSFFFSLVAMRPGNRAGTVNLRSPDPRDTPLINFNYFEQDGQRDLQALSEAAAKALRVFNGTGAPYSPFQIIAPAPGVEITQALMDDTYSHHATSSCRMGPKDDPHYCVDSKFRVNGVDGLRVVDASVFPRSPGGFPVAPTFIISQKASHVILADALEKTTAQEADLSDNKAA